MPYSRSQVVCGGGGVERLRAALTMLTPAGRTGVRISPADTVHASWSGVLIANGFYLANAMNQLYFTVVSFYYENI